MSEDNAPISREEQVLAEQMELELAAARHVQAKLLAADDPDEINGLGRTWQRVSRSLRQTVALKAKLTRERETAAASRPPAQPSAASPAEVRRRARIDAAGEAVREFMEHEGIDWDEAEDFALDEILIELSRDEGFAHMPMDEVVAHVLRRLGFERLDDDDDPEAEAGPMPAPAHAAPPPVQNSA